MNPHDIEPITALKRNAASLIERAGERQAPIVITQNGRATAVLQDVHSFAEAQRAFALLRLAIDGERDIVNGRSLTHTEHRKRITELLEQLKTR